ncbi:MAG: hypothetical protein GKR87_15985 [Kiritimatiellae bacterium]|nr:hypothetical protein [Kiritimatiellia bacterium]
MNPSQTLTTAYYQAQNSTTAADLAGNTLISNIVWSFHMYAVANDSDGDGVPDATELLLGLDPHQIDSDGDGISDGEEDTDSDGLLNIEEVLLGTDLNDTDTDTDTDNNGILDLNEDTDGDGLTDIAELITYSTDPLQADTDSDGFNDGDEIFDGSDPLDPNSLPPSLLLNSVAARFFSIINIFDVSETLGEA